MRTHLSNLSPCQHRHLLTNILAEIVIDYCSICRRGRPTSAMVCPPRRRSSMRQEHQRQIFWIKGDIIFVIYLVLNIAPCSTMIIMSPLSSWFFTMNEGDDASTNRSIGFQWRMECVLCGERRGRMQDVIRIGGEVGSIEECQHSSRQNIGLHRNYYCSTFSPSPSFRGKTPSKLMVLCHLKNLLVGALGPFSPAYAFGAASAKNSCRILVI